MATVEQNLSVEQKELVAIGASVGAGCHPCVDHHLKAGEKAGLGRGHLLAAVSASERVAAEAAFAMGDHVRGKLGSDLAEPALLSRLEEALASLGAALGANDARNIEHQLRAAVALGATRGQLEQAIETARAVQENAARIHVRGAVRVLDALVAPVTATENEAGSAGSCGCGAEDGEDPALDAETASPTGETTGIAAAMTRYHDLFEGACRQPVAPETDQALTALETVGTCRGGE